MAEAARQGRDIGEGAAQAAPTAPHATPRPAGGRKSGPERFWDPWRVRIMLGVALVLSGVAHCYAVPIEMPGADLQVNDFDGGATIPIDLFDQGQEQEQAVETPPPAPTGDPAADKGDKKTSDPAGLLPKPDAGAARDAGPRDASGDAPADAIADGAPSDAGSFDGGPFPLGGDAGDAGSTPQADPQALLAAAHAVQAKDPFVTLVLNGEEIRNHPLGAKVSPLLHSINEWSSFMAGTETFYDPIRDTDWMSISGPSLRDSRLDAITLHYSNSDANMDKAVEAISHNYSQGGPFDAGVAAMPAWLGEADNNPRVFLRPRSHLIVIVPPADAPAIAQSLSGAPAPPKSISWMAGKAAWLKLREPHHAMPGIMPQELSLVMAWITPHHDDGGVDVDVDGTCKDGPSADSAASQVKDLIARNAALGNMMTDGLLDGVEVRTEGSHVRVHVAATRGQAERTLKLLKAFAEAMRPQPQAPQPQASAPAPAASH